MANNYNPDVLNCIANLSNDEVFTPPALANQVLDMLPQELFSNPATTFLDPFTKSGVFLREIVKRLDRGLEAQIPDRQQRIDHIMHSQVFGIACTELTAHLSRRSLYCSKHPDGPHSVSRFETPEGISSTRPCATPGRATNASTAAPPGKSMTAAMPPSSTHINSFIQTTLKISSK